MRFRAFSYTEDSKADRVYFHKSVDGSDRDSFVILSEIVGVDRQAETNPIDWAAENEKFLSSPSTPALLRSWADASERRQKQAGHESHEEEA